LSTEIATIRRLVGWIVNRTPQDDEVDQWEREIRAALDGVETRLALVDDLAGFRDAWRERVVQAEQERSWARLAGDGWRLRAEAAEARNRELTEERDARSRGLGLAHEREQILLDRNQELTEALRDLVEDYEETDEYPTSDGHPLYRAREVLTGSRAALGETDQ
jgi:hypothetical protein